MRKFDGLASKKPSAAQQIAGHAWVAEVRAVQNISVHDWKWVVLEVYADPGSDVFVAGTFNEWKPSKFDKLRDKRRDGSYRLLRQMKKGRHEFRFLVNGSWCLNPGLPMSAPGNDATTSNVMNVA
jgi:Glycogen recognition site of AMP-activated protein kinase